MISLEEYIDLVKYVSSLNNKDIIYISSDYKTEINKIINVEFKVYTDDYFKKSSCINIKYGMREIKTIDFRLNDCTVENIKNWLDENYKKVEESNNGN